MFFIDIVKRYFFTISVRARGHLGPGTSVPPVPLERIGPPPICTPRKWGGGGSPQPSRSGPPSSGHGVQILVTGN